MNIFATYNSPQKSAIALDDKRVVKMVLESMQMLSTAIHFYGGESPYKPNHINHPCTIWARTNKENYQWLLEHFICLFKEYTYRYGKNHKCESYYGILKSGKKYIPDGKLTPFADCAALSKEYNFITNIHDRYRKCMINKWVNDIRKPEWKKRKKPNWFNDFKNIKKLKNNV